MVSIADSARAPSRGSAQAAPAPSGRLALPVRIYLLMVMIPFAFFAGPLYMTGVRLILLLVVAPLTVMLLSGRFGRLMVSDIFFMLFLFWVTLSLTLNHPDRVIEQVGSRGVEFWGGYLLGRCFIRTREHFITLCKTLSVLAALLLPLALYESQTGNPILIDMIRRIPGIRSEVIVNIEGRLGMERSQVIFAHPIHFGLFCSVAFALTFVALDGLLSTTRRILFSLMIGFATFLALSSGALLALALQIFMIGWFFVFRDHERKWTYLLILFVLMYIAIDILSTRSPIRVFMSYATFSAHNAYWRAIIFEWGMMNIFGSVENNIPPAPWFGIGLNDWVRPHFMPSGSVDNFWLATALLYGVPALILLLIGYVSTLFRVGWRDFTGDDRLEKLRRSWMFTFCGLSFTLATVHVWTTIYSFVFFMFGAGIWFLNAQPMRDGESQDSDKTTVPERVSRYTRFPVAPKADLGPARARST
ncbi:MAG: O-antigen ligase domain-containing protein [Pseudomonadota bacterium]